MTLKEWLQQRLTTANTVAEQCEALDDTLGKLENESKSHMIQEILALPEPMLSGRINPPYPDKNDATLVYLGESFGRHIRRGLLDNIIGISIDRTGTVAGYQVNLTLDVHGKRESALSETSTVRETAVKIMNDLIARLKAVGVVIQEETAKDTVPFNFQIEGLERLYDGHAFQGRVTIFGGLHHVSFIAVNADGRPFLNAPDLVKKWFADVDAINKGKKQTVKLPGVNGPFVMLIYPFAE